MKDVVFSTDKFRQVAYSVIGEGDPIVLLHGFPFDRYLWYELAEQLSGEFTLIIPDLPSSGKSTYTGETLTMEDMADFVKLILEHENCGPAIVAGHSMGGYVALAFASLYPELLRGLCLVHSLATADSEEKKQQRRRSIELFRKGGGALFVRQMVSGLFAEHNSKPLETAINSITERAVQTDPFSLERFYNAMIMRADRQNNLIASNIPVFWAIGENDVIAPPQKIMQQTSLANLNFVYVYSKCGHMGMVEATDALAHDMAAFARYCFGKE